MTEKEKELLKISLSCGISVDELKEAMHRMGECGIKAAQAGERLGVAFRRLNRFRLTNVSYKKMLRNVPKRLRKAFFKSVKQWEQVANQSRYCAVFCRSGDGKRLIIHEGR